MSLRCVLLSLVLVSFIFAADQSPTPAKPDSAVPSPTFTTPPDSSPPAKDDSSPSAKADAQGWRSHVHFGGLMIGAGYSHFSGGHLYGYGPGYWEYPPYYSYDPLLWPAFYHPGYYTGYAYHPGLGNVKIQAPDKTSLVFLNGGLAGRVDKLKDMWLEPGTYQLEVRNSNHRFTRKIYVLSGKTLRVTSDMMVSEALQ